MKIEINKPSFDTTKWKEFVEDNPGLVLGFLAVTATAAPKLMSANTARKNSATWRRRENRLSSKKS